MIPLAKNLYFHGRSKHISIKYHCICDLVKDKEIKLGFCKSIDQIVDILRKPLKADVFEKLKNMLSVISKSN